MLRIVAIYSSLLVFAFAILTISVFRAAAVKYHFPTTPYLHEFNSRVLGESVEVDYIFPYPGKVLPGSALWPVKVVRDRIWLTLTTNPERKAELLLLFADKRLASAKILFDEGNYDEAYSTITKAEKYLESASLQAMENYRNGRINEDFHKLLATAALKHYEVTNNILESSPDEMKTEIISVQRYPKSVYESSRNVLLGKGATPPENPFTWN